MPVLTMMYTSFLTKAGMQHRLMRSRVAKERTEAKVLSSRVHKSISFLTDSLFSVQRLQSRISALEQPRAFLNIIGQPVTRVTPRRGNY